MMSRALLALCTLLTAASCASPDEGPSRIIGAPGPAGPPGEAGPPGPKGDSPAVAAKEAIGNAPGPLPLNGSVTTGGGRLLLTISGSGYRQETPGTLGIDVTIDGTPMGSINAYTNEILSHKTLPARTLVIEGLIAGTHTVTLVAQADTMTDANDYFNVTVVELH